MVVSQLQAVCDGSGEPAEMTPHTLTDWLERLDPGGAGMGVDADALRRAVIYRDEHRSLTFAGEGGGQIGPPHCVHRFRNDCAIVGAGSARGPHAGRCSFPMSSAAMAVTLARPAAVP